MTYLILGNEYHFQTLNTFEANFNTFNSTSDE